MSSRYSHTGTKSSSVNADTSLFRQLVQEHEKPNSELDQAGADKFGADGERLLSGNPAMLAVVAAVKKHSRIRKGEAFNCFVLDRGSNNGDELGTFVQTLKAKISKFSEEARFQVVVHDRGHWYPIDIYIKNGQVSTFILDAANDPRFEGAHDLLKRQFPVGRHYQFIAECEYKDSAMQKTREQITPRDISVASIQRSSRGCRIFSFYHAMNMAKVPTESFYDDLERSSVSEYKTLQEPSRGHKPVEKSKTVPSPHTVTLSSIKPDSSLVRLLRPIQSYSALASLEQGVRDTVVRGSGDEAVTLEQHASKQKESSGGRNVNATMLNKSVRYRQKAIMFEEQTERSKIQSIMARRMGLTFLECPQLFELDSVLSQSDSDKCLVILKAFVENVLENTPQQTESSFLGFRLKARNLDLIHTRLSQLVNIIESFEENPNTQDKGNLVFDSMACITGLREELSQSHSKRALASLDEAITTFSNPDYVRKSQVDGPGLGQAHE